MRGEQKPGYLCGEMQSLVISQPIWSRYEWVIHTHADVFPTPELFSSLRAKLFGQSQTMSTSGSDGVSGIATRQNNRKRAPDVYVDRFPPRCAQACALFDGVDGVPNRTHASCGAQRVSSHLHLGA